MSNKQVSNRVAGDPVEPVGQEWGERNQIVQLDVQPLHGYDFLTYFEKEPVVKHFYDGVYSLDEIPKTLPLRHFVIVNLSKTNEEGTHWVVICRSDEYIYEIFNSLGFDTLDIIVPEHFLVDGHTDLVFNGHPFQMESTNTCGYFAVFFAVHRVFNYDLSFLSFLEFFFDQSTFVNEERVINFCQGLLNNDHHLFHDY